MQREVTKSITDLQAAIRDASKATKKAKKKTEDAAQMSDAARQARLFELERMMQAAAEKLDFETAIKLRQEWFTLRDSQ